MASHVHKKRKLSPPSSGVTNIGVTNGEILEASSEEETKASATKMSIRSNDRPRDYVRYGSRKAQSWGAYNPSMFMLQVDELLSKVRPDYERRMAKVENAIDKLKDIIKRIPNRQAKPVRFSPKSLNCAALTIIFS